MKHQMREHVENAKNVFSKERYLQHIQCHNIQKVWQTIEKSDEHEVAVDARKHFFEKEFHKTSIAIKCVYYTKMAPRGQ